MKNIKKITITLNDGEEISFEPKFDVQISQCRGKMNSGSHPYFPEYRPNNRETLVIISAPPDILETVIPTVDQIIENVIDT